MNKMMLKKQYMMYSPKKKGRLPSAYQEVEYIQSTKYEEGSTYIETNIKYNSNNRYVFEFEMNTFPTTKGDVSFGWDYGGQVNVQPSKLDNGMQKMSFNSLIKTKFVHTIEAGTNSNSIIVATNSSGTKTLTRTHPSLSYGASTYGYGIIIRFGIDGLSGFGAGQLYSFKCSINGVLTNELVPCYRKSDNEVGLYDIVNNQFYTNQGSGTFIKGADV